MVDIAQLVERWLVVPDVAGSSPVIHPTGGHEPPRWPGSIPGHRHIRARNDGSLLAIDEWMLMVEMDADTFEILVGDELDLLPDDMVDGLDNVVIVVEDRPEDGSLDLLGLYDGVALTERGQYGFGEMPDRILIYREPLLAICDDIDELRDQVHVTLVHEIAHYYGIDDTKLHELGWG